MASGQANAEGGTRSALPARIVRELREIVGPKAVAVTEAIDLDDSQAVAILVDERYADDRMQIERGDRIARSSLVPGRAMPSRVQIETDEGPSVVSGLHSWVRQAARGQEESRRAAASRVAGGGGSVERLVTECFPTSQREHIELDALDLSWRLRQTLLNRSLPERPELHLHPAIDREPLDDRACAHRPRIPRLSTSPRS